MTIYWYEYEPEQQHRVVLNTLGSLHRILKKRGNCHTTLPNKYAVWDKHVCVDPFMLNVFDKYQIIIAETFEDLVKEYNNKVHDI